MPDESAIIASISTVGLVLTTDQLAAMAPATARDLLEGRRPGLQRLLDISSANATPKRVAGVLARVSTETGGFRLVKEEASDWSGPNFENYLGKPGNITLQDCIDFAGKDYLQVSFKDNYRAATVWVQSLGIEVDFVANPELVIDPRYIGLASAWYILQHPGIIAAADAGDVDDISCWVNAGCSKAAWSGRHGLIDAKEAAAINKSNGWGPRDPQSRHGIFGLNETRAHYQLGLQALAA